MKTGNNAKIEISLPVKRETISKLRKTSVLTGILCLLTFVSVPTLALYCQVHEPGYTLGACADNRAF